MQTEHPAVHPIERLARGVHIDAKISADTRSIVTHDAMGFVADLVRRFAPRVRELLSLRAERQAEFERGALPDFALETAAIRADDWTVARLPTELLDRRVEITGPVDRKMIINALNSGANVFMADFEDSNSPTWSNCISGQRNLYDAVRRTIAFASPETGKSYSLNERVATLFVRPRGWHLVERHVTVDGKPVPAALFDFGLYFFHNARELLRRGTGPYFYLPKLESHREARLWNDVFVHAQCAIEIPRGVIKATVLIETLPAAFEMDEILYELREHSAGLNCGRWDYIFSYIKKLGTHADRILPDRSSVTMDKAFLAAYATRLVQTCHRRGAHAMGGMAAQIPIRDDANANARAIESVRADKLREVLLGHDGTWVAHPGLVAIAREVFDAHMPGANQIALARDVDGTPRHKVTRDDMLRVHDGLRTESGLRLNLRVAVQYVEAWLRGNGCVPIEHRMEDAATAEISRAQVWQWLRHGVTLADGRRVDRALVANVLREELLLIERTLGRDRFARGRFADARSLLERLMYADRFEEFLTISAYGHLDD